MRKVRLWLALVATLLATSAGAQSNLTVTAAEYFFDSDPGYGQATVINNVSGGELEIAIPTSNLSVGAHTLCLRTLASNGVWSTTMSKPIFVMSTGSEVAHVEYFFDNDPGYGKGTVLATSGSPDVTIEISTGDITPGAHMLYLRSQDTNGNWSSVMAHPIYVFTVLPVAALEFFIDDNDPGEGKAISVPVATATAATAIFDIDTSDLTPGEHTLNIRAMGIDSVWTAVSTRRFMVEGVAEPEPYAVLTENTATDGTATPAPNRAVTEKSYTLTFYYDDKKAERNGMNIGPFTSESQRGWSGVNRITGVMFDDSFAEYTELSSTAYWFFDFISLKSITGIKNLKTEKVTDMSNMFFRCTQLEEIDLSTLNTSNTTNMAYMFAYTGLTNLDVSLFNTSNVTNMSGMFIGSINLTTLDLTSFNTEKVTTMNSMFENSYNFTSIDISSFKTSSLTNADGMFYNCTALTTIFASEEWSTEKISEGSQMFRYSTKLVGGKGTTYDENHIDHTYAHIDGGTSNPGYFTDKNSTISLCPDESHPHLIDIGLSTESKVLCCNLGAQSPEGQGETFTWDELMALNLDNGYHVLTEKEISEIVRSERQLIEVNGEKGQLITSANGNSLFLPLGDYWSCDVNEDGHAYYMYVKENVVQWARTDKSEKKYARLAYNANTVITEPEPYAVLSDSNTILTFYYDEKKVERNGMDVGPFTESYENGIIVGVNSGWYNQRESITKVVFDASFANYTSLTSTRSWFYGCRNLAAITGLQYLKTDNVTDMYSMFDGCSSLKSIDVSGFNTENVTQMWWMFNGCSSLKSLDLSNFNTANVRSMSAMFSGCSSLTSLDLSSFNTTNVTSMKWMFDGCQSLITLNLSNFNTANLAGTNMDDLFVNCGSLASIVAGSANIPAEEYARVENPNLLVYVNEESLAPSNITNVVVNGFAKNIVLTDAKDGNNNFFVPESFKAEMVNYTREFRQETTVGVSRGWESIALPFNVQTITHEKWGAIAPFNNSQSSKHFWLRQLGENGLFSATKIEANVPYVISMPNDAATYPEDFLLAGKVTFSAENVTIPATEPVILALADSTIKMVPTFLRVDRSPDVWAINIGEVRGQYYEGSVFEREYRVVRPFEAYTVHRGNSPAPRFVPINSMISETTGIEEVENTALNAESYYDLNGRKLQGKPKTKGVYITNGRKVVIR